MRQHHQLSVLVTAGASSARYYTVCTQFAEVGQVFAPSMHDANWAPCIRWHPVTTLRPFLTYLRSHPQQVAHPRRRELCTCSLWSLEEHSMHCQLDPVQLPCQPGDSYHLCRGWPALGWEGQSNHYQWYVFFFYTTPSLSVIQVINLPAPLVSCTLK